MWTQTYHFSVLQPINSAVGCTHWAPATDLQLEVSPCLLKTKFFLFFFLYIYISLLLLPKGISNEVDVFLITRWRNVLTEALSVLLQWACWRLVLLIFMACNTIKQDLHSCEPMSQLHLHSGHQFSKYFPLMTLFNLRNAWRKTGSLNTQPHFVVLQILLHWTYKLIKPI